MKTNIEKLFLKLRFPTAHKFHKIVSHSTVKTRYCCIKNMGSITSSHNKQVLQTHNENYGCNCRKKESCPLESLWLMLNMIYEAEITSNTNKVYRYS